MAKGGRIYGKETICNKGTVRRDREKSIRHHFIYMMKRGSVRMQKQ